MNISGISNNKNLWKEFDPYQNKTSFSLPNKQQVDDNQNIDKKNQKTKSSINIKNTLDYISVALGLIIIAIPLIANIKTGKAEKIVKQTENLEKKTRILIKEVEDLKNKQSGQINKLPLISKIGLFWDKLAERKELTNNLIYGLGTILIEPLVILFSPFGKEKSTKEDKIFAVWRQPISFLTTFALQFSVDKFFHGLVPKLSRHGFLGEEFKARNYSELPLAKATKLKALQETSIIVLNLMVLPISSMLQNVLYGKFTKSYYSHNKKESDKA